MPDDPSPWPAFIKFAVIVICAGLLAFACGHRDRHHDPDRPLFPRSTPHLFTPSPGR